MTLLLLGGFDVNALNPKGDTPLHIAVTFKPNPNEANTLKAMLELLIDSGADPKLENIYGQTAMNYCATDEARRILSEKSGLEAMTFHSRDVSKYIKFISPHYVLSFLIIVDVAKNEESVKSVVTIS